MGFDNLKLQTYFDDYVKHLHRINETHEELKTFIPTKARQYTNLSHELAQVINQYLFRFFKLQNILSNKAFQILVSLYDSKPNQINNKKYLGY